MARWKKERRGPSGAHPGGQQEGEAMARSVSAVCPSFSCSGTTPGERGKDERSKGMNRKKSRIRKVERPKVKRVKKLRRRQCRFG